MRHISVFFVMGPTCSGKSTLLEELTHAISPDDLGLVEVGKMMRAKYPPEHFQGQCNPKHTQQEAWEMCESAIRGHKADGKTFIVVDGQPRDREQARLCASRFPEEDGYNCEYILLDASLEERERRARIDRSGDDLEKLAIPRLTNDMIAYYGVLVELAFLGKKVIPIDTTNEDEIGTVEFMHSIIDYMKASHREHCYKGSNELLAYLRRRRQS